VWHGLLTTCFFVGFLLLHGPLLSLPAPRLASHQADQLGRRPQPARDALRHQERPAAGNGTLRRLAAPALESD